MALKVELKPGERIILGECVVTNDAGQRTNLLIEGGVPILREKDIMTPERADTPAKRIYLAVQFMYTARDPQHASRPLLLAACATSSRRRPAPGPTSRASIIKY